MELEPKNTTPPFRVLLFGYTSENIGDILQTIALTRLLPHCVGIYRERIRNGPGDKGILVANGFLYDFPSNPQNCLFAGIHIYSGRNRIFRRYVRHKALRLGGSRYPIGARDPATHSLMRSIGLDASLIGCATLTFDRYEGPRQGVVSVDCDGPGTRITHRIAPTMSVKDQWRLGLELVRRYRTATLIYTSRLHAALLGLAFGTPICFVPNKSSFDEPRYSILAHLGVRPHEVTTADVVALRDSFTSFLRINLSIQITPGEPTYPEPEGSPVSFSPWRHALYHLLCY